MSLEDHAGDVVRKARLMAGVASAESARAGGISVAQLEEFEDSGSPPEGLDWEGMADALDLHPGKLRMLAQGWQPAPVDSARWASLRQITTRDERMSVHCYLAWDPQTRQAALFDTGFDADAIFRVVDQENLRVECILITHTHYDHVSALEAVRARAGSARLRTSARSAPAQARNSPGERIQIGGMQITHRETPGHAADGVTYLIEFPGNPTPAAVVGDAIFAGSIGGAPDQGGLARDRIRSEILSLPDDALICPGHGPLTTVGEQKAANPFFRGG